MTDGSEAIGGYDPDDGLRDLLKIWEGTASVDEHASLEFFLLAVLGSHGAEGIAEWVRGFPATLAAEAEVTGNSPEVLIRFTRAGRAPLVIAGSADGDMSWVDVSVEAPPSARPAQHPHHAAFYSIWERLSDPGSGPDGPRSDAESAVFLIGLLESEVMNGGLGQYLTNTEGAYVPETLECLEKIGATKMLGLLKSAVELASDDESFVAAWDRASESYARLDGEFLDSGEDLAGLTAITFLR